MSMTDKSAATALTRRGLLIGGAAVAAGSALGVTNAAAAPTTAVSGRALPAMFVPEERWAPQSWGINHPLTVRAQREHGLEEAKYGFWGGVAGGLRQSGRTEGGSVPVPGEGDALFDSSRTLPDRWRLTCGARTVKGVRVTNDSAETGSNVAPTDNPVHTLDQLERAAGAAINELAQQTDPEAFQALLRLSALVGEALGVSARTLATTGSWAKVAEAAGTSRQAAWSRWSS